MIGYIKGNLLTADNGVVILENNGIGYEIILKAFDNQEMFESIEEVLDTVDKDARIAASTFFIPHLADRAEIYEVYYTEQSDFEYLVFDMRPAYREESLKIAEKFEDIGYELFNCENENVFIYKKAE